jgi:hypothetical protein
MAYEAMSSQERDIAAARRRAAAQRVDARLYEPRLRRSGSGNLSRDGSTGSSRRKTMAPAEAKRRTFAATRIQAVWRGGVGRQVATDRWVAVFQIQRFWRGALGRRRGREARVEKKKRAEAENRADEIDDIFMQVVRLRRERREERNLLAPEFSHITAVTHPVNTTIQARKQALGEEKKSVSFVWANGVTATASPFRGDAAESTASAVASASTATVSSAAVDAEPFLETAGFSTEQVDLPETSPQSGAQETSPRSVSNHPRILARLKPLRLAVFELEKDDNEKEEQSTGEYTDFSSPAVAHSVSHQPQVFLQKPRTEPKALGSVDSRVAVVESAWKKDRVFGGSKEIAEKQKRVSIDANASASNPLGGDKHSVFFDQVDAVLRESQETRSRLKQKMSPSTSDKSAASPWTFGVSSSDRTDLSFGASKSDEDVSFFGTANSPSPSPSPSPSRYAAAFAGQRSDGVSVSSPQKRPDPFEPRVMIRPELLPPMRPVSVRREERVEKQYHEIPYPPAFVPGRSSLPSARPTGFAREPTSHTSHVSFDAPPANPSASAIKSRYEAARVEEERLFQEELKKLQRNEREANARAERADWEMAQAVRAETVMKYPSLDDTAGSLEGLGLNVVNEGFTPSPKKTSPRVPESQVRSSFRAAPKKVNGALPLWDGV